MGNLKQEVATAIEATTAYDCRIDTEEVGMSGNVWEVDVAVDSYGHVREGYVEVEDNGPDINRSTYTNHMRRAYAQMGDFRAVAIPKAVVVRNKFGSKRRNWDALFDSIDCQLLDIDDLDDFITWL